MKIRTLLTTILVASAISATVPAFAGQDPGGLGNCLADHTSGKERKELARWVFLAMGAHPEIRDLLKADKPASNRSDEAMGRLMMRLLTEDCKVEVRAAAGVRGRRAVEDAFEALGRLAMQEIMSDQDVKASMAGFTGHMDLDKLGTALFPEK